MFDYKINKFYVNRKFNVLFIQFVLFKFFWEIEFKISIFFCFVSCYLNYFKVFFIFVLQSLVKVFEIVDLLILLYLLVVLI